MRLRVAMFLDVYSLPNVGKYVSRPSKRDFPKSETLSVVYTPQLLPAGFALNMQMAVVQTDRLVLSKLRRKCTRSSLPVCIRVCARSFVFIIYEFTVLSSVRQRPLKKQPDEPPDVFEGPSGRVDVRSSGFSFWAGSDRTSIKETS